MLTDQDIQKLKKVLATKEDLQEVHGELKEVREDLQEVHGEIGGLQKDFREFHGEFNDLRTIIQGLSVSVDGLAKSIDDSRIEHAAVLGTLERHERWHKQIAEETGVRLED